MRRSAWVKVAAPLVAFGLLAAACGDSDEEGGGGAEDTATGGETAAPTDDGGDTGGEATGGEATGGGEDFGGAQVTVTGPERDESEAASIQEVLGAFGAEHGIEVTYLGDADWETNINIQVEGGNPPDIGIFPQPGKLRDFANAGNIIALPDNVVASIDENWPASWASFGNVDGTQFGVPVKADLKSLVWYQPARFEELGYTVPETLDDFKALLDQAVADGHRPLCVGIESGAATGWPFTDWVEDLMLRRHGPDVYDQWVAHEIPFNDPMVVEVMQEVVDMWVPENVYASSGSIAATAFQDNGQPLVDGQCLMHRQASFYAAFFPEGTAFADGSEQAVDVFYFPDTDGSRPVLGAGTLAAGFNDEPATIAVLEFMSTAEYASQRQAAQAAAKGGGLSGFLSAAYDQDPSVYTDLELSFIDILTTAEIVRFDASDLMPAEVGAGTFWSQGTSLVNGDVTAQAAADAIEASWPTG